MNFNINLPVRIVSSKDCVKNNSHLLKALGTKALIVTSSTGAKKSGALDDITAALNNENIGYSHNPTVFLSIEQSLFPSFFQGVSYDPNVKILEKNLQMARYSKEAIEQSLIENITQYYIQQRCTLRMLEKYERYIQFYDKKIEAAKKLLSLNPITNPNLPNPVTPLPNW